MYADKTHHSHSNGHCGKFMHYITTQFTLKGLIYTKFVAYRQGPQSWGAFKGPEVTTINEGGKHEIPLNFVQAPNIPRVQCHSQLIRRGRLAVSKLPIRTASVIEGAAAQREETEKATGQVPGRCLQSNVTVSNSRGTFRCNDWKPHLRVAAWWLSISRSPTEREKLESMSRRDLVAIFARRLRLDQCSATFEKVIPYYRAFEKYFTGKNVVTIPALRENCFWTLK